MTTKSAGDASGNQLLERLRSHLNAKNGPNTEGISSADSQAEYLTQNQLAAALFAKAEEEFLADQTLDRLVSITSDAMSCLEQFLTGKQALVLRTQHNAHHGSITIALGDRPFIINTIIECINEFEVELAALLHPVIHARGQRVSLSFIEVSAVSAEALELLSARLSSALSVLRDVTDDFSSMLIRAETLARILRGADQGANFARAEREQVGEFLHWLASGGLVFLGYQSCPVSDAALAPCENRLGLLKDNQPFQQELQRELLQDNQALIESAELFGVTKLRSFSPVHRKSRMLNISVMERSPNGGAAVVHCFIGVLTSRAKGEESSSMPIIRAKLLRILELEQALEGSHDYKTIVNIFDGMPKEDALRLELSALADIVRTALSVHTKHDTRAALHMDKLGRGASVLVALSRERFSHEARRRIQAFLEERFALLPGSSEFSADLSRHAQANLYFYLPCNQDAAELVDIDQCAEQIARLTRSWVDNLRDALDQRYPAAQAEQIWFRYAKAFSQDYQALYDAEACLADIEQIEKLDGLNQIRIGFQRSAAHGAEHAYLILYSLSREVTVSRAVPVLENVGLEVISQSNFCARPRNSEAMHIQRFLVHSRFFSAIRDVAAEQSIVAGLQSIFSERSINDRLNALLISARLSAQSVSGIRLYAALLWQLRRLPSREIICEALTTHPEVSAKLWQIFDVRFNPALELSEAQRANEQERLRNEILEQLRGISEVNWDRALRCLLDLVEHTVRTNFYLDRSEIAVKLCSEEVLWIPNPRPKFEIFVIGPEIEGTHLRADMVARGGIRWSERKEDFRSEVLGLMKTQKVKNALIVPSGAKGGFIVKRSSPEQRPSAQEVEEAYRKYIRALLSITDNRKENQICHPQGVLCYDGPDPYFVVAADKGTASFSDVANQIAVQEFNFWLGDAFASGGSNGYDHKLYGITARGAWECVLRHFHDLNIDYVHSPFSAVGIGDMSGDVFGNGLLLSSNVRLLAAFDHRHVFVDPDPDPRISFQERKRLFEQPRSSWADYNARLISAGGGVFRRAEKEVQLSDQMRQALSIPADEPNVVSGERLIALVLQAKVDLLWNGGIGTYVKSRAESHSEVSDSSNDNVRINADELRARVVGEGGNLGFTQRARIDFAARSGRLNTDAIDNSGGVDLSDHEVNLKILFAELIRAGKVSLDERNSILKQLAPAITADVLSHNRNHALLMTLGVKRSKNRQDYFRSLIAEVHLRGFIDRKLETLPDDEELLTRIKRGEGLLRPELAVCCAAVKMWTKAELLGSDLIESSFLDPFLLNYFPEILQKRFRAEILAHPLSANIRATQITNALIDQLGISFIHRMCLSTSASVACVAKCALAAGYILRSNALRAELWKLDSVASSSKFLEAMQDFSGAHRFMTYWLVTTHADALGLEQLVERYAPALEKLLPLSTELLRGADAENYKQRLQGLRDAGLSDACAYTVAIAPLIALLLEVCWIAHHTRQPVSSVVPAWYEVVRCLQIAPLLKMEPGMRLSNRFEKEIAVSSYHEIRRAISGLAAQFLQGQSGSDTIAAELAKEPGLERLLSTISEIRSRNAEVSALAVLAKQLESFRQSRA